MPLLECVPNLSEGRRPEVIAELAAEILAVRGAHLLDVSCDPDHNRAVLTMVGAPEALQEAILALFRVALDRVDLRRHAGVHPRIGVVDVVPFVPLEGAPMELAVGAARSLGERLAERFGVPVFLYEEAATSPERRNLAALRRGGVDGLRRRLEKPEWRPDFGPWRLHPKAGATAVGARGLLIAFNARLDTADVDVARAIARAVRESSGGLPAVKALGVFLESRGAAQVSMNLVDFRVTSPRTALAAVRREAERLGVEVVETELVGLIPQGALGDATPESLGLRAFDRRKILEVRLDAVGGQPAPDED